MRLHQLLEINKDINHNTILLIIDKFEKKLFTSQYEALSAYGDYIVSHFYAHEHMAVVSVYKISASKDIGVKLGEYLDANVTYCVRPSKYDIKEHSTNLLITNVYALHDKYIVMEKNKTIYIEV